MLLRLIAFAVLALVLVSGPASAFEAPTEPCRYGAISAIGPVDAQGTGDTTPDVRCLEP